MGATVEGMFTALIGGLRECGVRKDGEEKPQACLNGIFTIRSFSMYLLLTSDC
jgi:hypothetical protein